MEPLKLDDWNRVYDAEDMGDKRGEEFAPILFEGSSEEVIKGLERVLGDDDFIWEVWDEEGILKQLVGLGVVHRALLQFEGQRCMCCGNYCGTVRLYDADGRQVFEFEFSD